MAKGPTVQMRRRMLIVMSVITLVGFCTLIVRLVLLQIVSGEEYQRLAIEQQLRDEIIQPERGTIYDTNMQPLAESATVWTVYISPNDIKTDAKRQSIAENLANLLSLNKDDILEKMKKNTYYVEIAKKVEKPTRDLIVKYVADNNVVGVHLAESSKRYYPNGDFASAVLGFTGTDNTGLSGLEAYYNSYLQGQPGKVVAARNAKGTAIPLQYEKIVEPKNGDNLILTMDSTIQYYLEKNLEMAVADNNVNNRACGIVMNVKTGAILAMATKPGFDPNDPFTIADPDIAQALSQLQGDELTKQRNYQQQQQWRNKAVSDTYEPGSVFKILTASMALEEKVVDEKSTFYCPGYYVVAGRKISCWKPGGHGSETFLQGLMNSCNPVFMMTGALVGPQKFFEYFSAFGLTQKTNVDLPGEAGGSPALYHALPQLKAVELASSSFGQTFKVTPIQLITAISAVANSGKLMQPYIVKSITDNDGNIVSTTEPKEIRQVISADTSKKLSGYLEMVVSQGTGKNAYVAGYRVAGKTGTSEKIDEADANGEVNKLIASFCGFAPADDPQIAVLVLLDEPNASNNFGGVIAAPVVGRILADVLPYIGIEPIYTQEELANMGIQVPNVTGLEVEAAKTQLKNAKLNVKIQGNGSTVISQTPSATQTVPKNCTVVLYTNQDAQKATVTVPDFNNLTVSEANKRCVNAGLNLNILGKDVASGDAVAIKQSIQPGTEVQSGTLISVEFVYQDQIH